MIRSLHRKLKKSRGFTLVELMIVVAIVGILAALAIYGVNKYMANAKTAEAKNALGQLGKDATTAFNREKMASAVLAETAQTTVSNSLCLDTDIKTVPDEIAKVKGKKYQSSAAEWDVGSKAVGWRCLKFSISDPQYYMYKYDTDDAGAAGFTATAQGDLDGDDVVSTFTLTASVQGGRVTIAPTIDEDKAEE